MSESRTSTVASSGIGGGAVMAAILSWHVNHSIGYMLLHMMCSWIYVIYWAVTY